MREFQEIDARNLEQMFRDEHAHYLCTVHKVISKDGIVIHEDIKDAVLNGIWYRSAKDKIE